MARSPHKPMKTGLVLLLGSGTVTTLLGKVLYTLRAPGRDGELHYFEKPYFSTMLMFMGMVLCLPASWLYRALISRFGSGTPSSDASHNNEESLLPHVESSLADEVASLAVEAKQWWEKYNAVLWPMLFDLLATVLMSVGLLFTTASIYQMVRGTEIIFTALLSAVFLRRRLKREAIFGLALCTLGIGLVGWSSMLSARSEGRSMASVLARGLGSTSIAPTAHETLVGMGLIVLAEAVQASQVVAEDYLLSSASSTIPPVQLVGYEGLFGMVVMLAVVLPAMQVSRLGPEGGGLQEDSLESLHMLRHSRPLAATALLFVAGMSVYNIAGMWVTDSLGALSRTVAESLRTLLVWLLDLWLFYHLHTKAAKVGEPWTRYSWLQAVGFGVLVVGTLVYSHGEERQAKAMSAELERRARERWARLRGSVADFVLLGRMQMTAEEKATPYRPTRIAGPARIRTALRMLRAPGAVRAVRGPQAVAAAAASTGQPRSAATAAAGGPGGATV